MSIVEAASDQTSRAILWNVDHVATHSSVLNTGHHNVAQLSTTW